MSPHRHVEQDVEKDVGIGSNRGKMWDNDVGKDVGTTYSNRVSPPYISFPSALTLSHETLDHQVGNVVDPPVVTTPRGLDLIQVTVIRQD